MKTSDHTNSIACLLQQSSKQLEDSSDSPLLDAQLLLADVLDKDRSYLIAWPEIQPEPQQLQLFNQYLSQRIEGIPVAYILGYKEFWSLKLKVTADVLIPRPETELLVEQVIEACSQINQPTILELGTGSGAIAIALAKELPSASITATDLSEAALNIAQQNALDHHTNQIQFIQSDWFQQIITGAKFDFIISNPPYIENEDPHLAGEIRHEPFSALVSGEDGLDDIRIILKNATHYLNQQGMVMLEHGYNQGTAIRKLTESYGYKHCLTLKDYSANERLTLAHWV